MMNCICLNEAPFEKFVTINNYKKIVICPIFGQEQGQVKRRGAIGALCSQKERFCRKGSKIL